MTEHHWGIKGWKPNWVSSASKLSRTLAELELINQIFKGTWSLWDNEAWFEDAPVIFEIGKYQLEFCANKIGEFSVTKNTIDTNAVVSWCEEPSDTGDLTWRKNAHSEFLDLLGSKVTEVGVVEYNLDEGLQNLLGQSWVLSGSYIFCGARFAKIFNALDCNGLSNKKNHIKGLRYIANRL